MFIYFLSNGRFNQPGFLRESIVTGRKLYKIPSVLCVLDLFDVIHAPVIFFLYD